MTLSIAVATAGLFLIFMGLYGGARPCSPEACADPRPGLLAAGIGSLVIAAVGIALSVRDVRR